MTSKLHRLNPLRLLNSVPFGITTMVLIACYMAIGSGRPWLRSAGLDQWTLFRDWFDKTDLEFFNSWPLKTLMALLVANLVVVTWRKIPLTPPRYGVWCVHAGIITLVLGTATYYNRKLEGLVRIYADPVEGPNWVDHFYDKDERALYVRSGRDMPAMFPLPALPRFQEYSDDLGNVDALRRRGLWDIRPTLTTADRDGKPAQEGLPELVGAQGDLRVDVVGYYPYADVRTSFDVTDPASATSGVELSMSDPRDPQTTRDWYVVGSDPRFRTEEQILSSLGVQEQHLDLDAPQAAKLVEAAGQLFRLDVTAAGRPGGDKPLPMYVQVGRSYPVGQTGYSLKVESYNPAWPTIEHELVPALTLMVTAPAQQFRRMVLQGKSTQTDFKLGVAGAPPMGQRQKAGPLDAVLSVAFHVEDPFSLLAMSQDRSVKHTLLTPPGSKELIDVEVHAGGETLVHHFPDGGGDLEVAMGAAPAGGGDPAAAAAAEPDHPPLRVRVDRRDHLKPVDSVASVPPSRREEQADEEGSYQVAKLRLRMGSWSQDVIVPFAPEAYERVRQDPWRGGFVTLPGAVVPLQFQLSNTRRPLPVRLTLDRFEVIPFAGGGDSTQSFIQDYRSTVTLSGADDADLSTEVAHLNSPIYFDGGRWLFFQASYDPNAPHAWTMLGVGNRPAVRVMEAGCLLIVIGLLYAFYAKPVIVRRMKERALEAAAAAGRGPRAKAAAGEPAQLVEL